MACRGSNARPADSKPAKPIQAQIARVYLVKDNVFSQFSVGLQVPGSYHQAYVPF